ncbi:MAG: hypothetical protein ACRC7W_02770 [Fusobacteriaceae bacterium]
MKKYLIILMTILFSTLSLAQEKKEIPKDVRQRISDLAVTNTDGGQERVDFRIWQEESYLYVEKKLDESGITESEKVAVRKRLNTMYGANYAKQTREVQDQIKYYTTVSRAATEKKKVADRNVESKTELVTVIKEAEKVVPAKIMNHYKAEAERLYPSNYYEQKRYIESSVNTYKMFN